MSYESALRAYVAAHAPTRAGQRSATDALIATAGLDRLGAALLRLRLLADQHEYGPTLRHLQPAVRKELAIRGLATSGEAARRAAARALRAWLAGPCQACQGRRYEQIPGAPTLSDRPCQGCAGTGSRISDFMQGSDRDQLACALILIEHRYGHAIGALRARLYGPKITTRVRLLTRTSPAASGKLTLESMANWKQHSGTAASTSSRLSAPACT